MGDWLKYRTPQINYPWFCPPSPFKHYSTVTRPDGMQILPPIITTELEDTYLRSSNILLLLYINTLILLSHAKVDESVSSETFLLQKTLDMAINVENREECHIIIRWFGLHNHIIQFSVYPSSVCSYLTFVSDSLALKCIWWYATPSPMVCHYNGANFVKNQTKFVVKKKLCHYEHMWTVKYQPSDSCQFNTQRVLSFLPKQKYSILYIYTWMNSGYIHIIDYSYAIF